MNIELKQAAQRALLALRNSQPHPSSPFIGLTDKDFIDHEETIRQLRAALQQAEVQKPATPEPVEDGIRNAEDELSCAEEVLDAITCEFSEGEFPVTDFNCIGDYITAVVDVFKERLAAQCQVCRILSPHPPKMVQSMTTRPVTPQSKTPPP